jgi:hypothetical protein
MKMEQLKHQLAAVSVVHYIGFMSSAVFDVPRIQGG